MLEFTGFVIITIGIVGFFIGIIGFLMMDTIRLYTGRIKEFFGQKQGQEDNQLSKPCKEALSFYQELEDAYYNKYPEQWENEASHKAVGDSFVAILEGYTEVIIPSYEGERATNSCIERGKRKLWIVGNVYEVARKMNTSSEDVELDDNTRQATYEIGPSKGVGTIRLVNIIPKECENILVFEAEGEE